MKIENGQKYVERIEKGEADIEKYRLINEAIDQKIYYTMKEHSKENALIDTFTVSDIPYTILTAVPESKKVSQSFSNPNPLFDFT